MDCVVRLNRGISLDRLVFDVKRTECVAVGPVDDNTADEMLRCQPHGFCNCSVCRSHFMAVERVQT